jgi:hypothetical protein
LAEDTVIGKERILFFSTSPVEKETWKEEDKENTKVD